MTKTSHKGYLAPWSSRRETVGLMGTLLVFLIGFPGRSDTLVHTARQLVRQLVQLMLVFLGLSTPTAQTPAIPVAHPVPVIHKAHVRAPMKADPNSMFLRTDPVLHRFTYIFEGKATFHHQPCSNASVLVRMVSGERTVAKGAVTDADGSYHLEVAIDAENRAPVDWTMEAYTADFNKVELNGRQIVQHEQPVEQEQEKEKKPIIVTNPVEFVVSFYK